MENLWKDKMSSYKTLWNKLKKEIKETTNERMFGTWIEPVKPIALNRSILVLELPNQFFYEWIETHYKNQFEKILKEKLKEEIQQKVKDKMVVTRDRGKPVIAVKVIVDDPPPPTESQLGEPSLSASESLASQSPSES